MFFLKIFRWKNFALFKQAVKSYGQAEKMSQRKSSLGISVLFWGLAATFAVLGFFFWEALNESRERLAELKRTEQSRSESVIELDRQKNHNTAYLDRIQDKEFLTQEARQRLGLVANPGEVIIQVEQAGAR